MDYCLEILMYPTAFKSMRAQKYEFDIKVHRDANKNWGSQA